MTKYKRKEGRRRPQGGPACVYDPLEEMCVHYSCIIGYLCLLNKEEEEEEEDLSVEIVIILFSNRANI
jgi:hypothetical protein